MSQKNQLTTADYLPYEEYRYFISSLHKDKNYMLELFARLSFCTACRGGDVLRFTWLDVLDKAEVRVVEQKTKKCRVIPIGKTMQQSIHQLWDLMGRPDRSEYVFKSPLKDDQPLSIQYINRKLKRARCRYRMSIKNFTTHTFRKTFGRYVYEKMGRSAESLILLNSILRHSSIQITKVYIGITADETNQIFNSIVV